MDNYLAALLERQAKDRAALSASLDETREARAWERTRVELDQPAPPHPSWATPERKSPEDVFKRHVHNLGIEDKRQLSALDKHHADELSAAQSKVISTELKIEDHSLSLIQRVKIEHKAWDEAKAQVTEPAKEVGSPPQMREAEDAHAKNVERQAAEKRDADQRLLEEIRAKMRAERDRGLER